MRKRMIESAFCIAAFAMSAAAQTVNNIPKYSATGTLTGSSITEVNGNVGIGTTAPRGILDVSVAKANDAKQSAYVGGSSWDLTLSGSEDNNGSASLWHNAYTTTTPPVLQQRTGLAVMRALAVAASSLTMVRE
ncbi:MAG: hypothetical protein ABR991_13840 [Terracidiphilus sp.]|jgi:hypothetical protein